MAALQTVAFGAASDGSQGDSVRTGFTKDNANVAVLQTQAALTTYTGGTITAAQALTKAHVGQRVNINLATAGTINLPSASTCGADNVLFLRNLGTTVVTIAITTGSGDTCALTKINSGETALLDTDGVHTWNVLVRGRTNSDNEVVNGNCTVNGNETVGGTLTASSSLLANGSLVVANAFAAFGQAGLSAAQATGSSVYYGTTITYRGAVYNQTATDVNLWLSKPSSYTSGGFVQFYYSGSSIGSIYANGNTTGVVYNTTSDYRLKDGLVPISDDAALSSLRKSVMYRGYFKSDPAKTEVDLLVAHEIAEIVPEAVTGVKDAVEYHPVYRDGYDPENVQPSDIVEIEARIIPQQVDHSKLVVRLWAINKALLNLVESCEARIAALEAKDSV